MSRGGFVPTRAFPAAAIHYIMESRTEKEFRKRLESLFRRIVERMYAP